MLRKGDLGVFLSMQGRYVALFMSVNKLMRFNYEVTSVLCVHRNVSQWVIKVR